MAVKLYFNLEKFLKVNVAPNTAKTQCFREEINYAHFLKANGIVLGSRQVRAIPIQLLLKKICKEMPTLF